MAKLQAGMCPVLTNSVIEKLAERKIFTIIDVLQEDPKKLSSISTLSFQDVRVLRDTLIAKYSPFPRQGLAAYKELISSCAVIPTGICGLDSLMGGGLLNGNIVEICGLSGVGKTQLCLTIASNVAFKLQHQVHFVDTKLDFSGKRIHGILEAHGVCEEELKKTMEKIHVTQAHDFSQLYSFLCLIKDQLLKEPGTVRLIIIESLPAIFLQYMGGSKMDSLGLMNNLCSLMKYIAQEHLVAFFVVNLATKWMEEDSTPLPTSDSDSDTCLPAVEIKPVLGKYWMHVPTTRLYLEQCGSTNNRKITVLKSANISVGDFCNVKLTNKGVI